MGGEVHTLWTWGADHFRLHSCDFGVRFPVLGQCGSSVPHCCPDWEKCKYSSMEKVNTDPKKVNKSGPILGRYILLGTRTRVWATRVSHAFALRLRVRVNPKVNPKAHRKSVFFFGSSSLLSVCLSVCLFVCVIVCFVGFIYFYYTILYSCYNVQFRPVSSAEFLVLIRVQILCIIVRRCKGRKFA